MTVTTDAPSSPAIGRFPVRRGRLLRDRLATIAIVDLPYLGDTSTSADSLREVYEAMKVQPAILQPRNP